MSQHANLGNSMDAGGTAMMFSAEVPGVFLKTIAEYLATGGLMQKDAILVREVETNRQLYHDVLQRIHEMSVNGDAPLPNVSIVEGAQVPPSPSSPKKLKSLTIAGLIGMII